MATVSRRAFRPSPDPGLSASIELCCGDAPSLVDFTGVGKILPSQRIAAKESPPSLLQIEPARSFGNEDLVKARMLCQPRIGFRTQMTGQIIGNHKDVPLRIIRF